jgi:superfamily II DNA or RNA helicase
LIGTFTTSAKIRLPQILDQLLNPMARAIRLRPWQKAALDALHTQAAAGDPDFLAVATPGAGKTTFALAAATLSLSKTKSQRLVVCAPTAHLKLQWAQAATRFGLHLDPFWASSSGQLPSDMHGIVTTYQQVSTSAAALRKLTTDAFVILDEIHHAGDDRAWGDSVRKAFEPAAQRLSSSRTNSKKQFPTMTTDMPARLLMAASCVPFTFRASTGSWNGSHLMAPSTLPALTMP